ncbi:hypothetical protein J6590_064957 [Homalodisca vitripennis]|nr:hypothetical protein J6590_064957 [Homalodisca vitripennis]
MAAQVGVGLFLISLSSVHSVGNINILSLPINLTAWKTSFREAVNHSLSHPFERITNSFRGLVDFTKNGTVDCTLEGEECPLVDYTDVISTIHEKSSKDERCNSWFDRKTAL